MPEHNDEDTDLIADKLNEYLDGTLDPEEMALVAHRLQNDVWAREVMIEELTIRGLLHLASQHTRAQRYAYSSPEQARFLRDDDNAQTRKRKTYFILLTVLCVVGFFVVKCHA